MPKMDHFSYTALSDYQRCQRKFYYNHVRRLTTPRRQTALEFGAGWHSAQHVWHTTRDLAKAQAAFDLAWGECGGDDAGDTLRTAATAKRMMAEYSQRYAEEPFKVVASEEAGEFDEGGFLFVFRLDRRLDWGGKPVLGESKTTKYLTYTYFQQFKPNLQVDMYLIGARKAYGIPYQDVLVDASWVGKIDTTKKKLEERHVRDITSRTDGQLDETRRLIVDLAKEITGKGKFEEFLPNFGACSDYGGCPYREVCASPLDVRERILAADFTVKPLRKEEV